MSLRIAKQCGNLKIFKIKFAVLKNVRIFAVQYRGIEQLVARRAHNPEAGGSSPPPATTEEKPQGFSSFFCYLTYEKTSPCTDLGNDAKNSW